MRRILPSLLALAACTPPQPSASPSPAPAPAAAARTAGQGRIYALVEVDEVPELQNRDDVGVAIRAFYPTLMRDAGIEGSATVRFVVGTDGLPERSTIQVVRSSHEQFTAGAERVAARMRFSPAKLGGAAVRAWVTMPISFSLH